MGLALVMQCRAPEPEDPVVSKRTAARPLGTCFTAQMRRTEVRMARIQRRALLEQEARVAAGGLRLPERPGAELPVGMIHREITTRVEATPPLEEQHMYSGLCQRHCGKATARPGADDHDVECFLHRGRHR